MPRLGRFALALLLVLATLGSARAEDFYQGKTLTLIIGFAPGGGVDSGARLIARHFTDFIPGKPDIVVQNMSGASGVVAANHIYARVKPDGLTLSVPGREWPMGAALHDPGVVYDPLKLSWIGSSGAVNDFIWIRTDTGIKSFADLKKAKTPIAFGGLGRSTATAAVPMLLAQDGVPIQAIPGYDSTSKILLAIEQKEVSGIFTNEATFARRRDMIDGGMLIPIAQLEQQKPGLPLFQDIIPADQRPLLEALEASDRFGLSLVGPPKIPADRLAILRQAFMAMAMDKAFQDDARKISEPVGAPIDGAALAKLVAKDVQGTTPSVVAAYKSVTEEK